jgi:eukaryotic-like serine/threonine-protein kinase
MAETELAQDPFELCGTTIEGKYRVSSVVGDGGFGVVYRGVHIGFGELIAIKCLKLPHALAEKERDGLLEQLREEGRLLHRLSKATSGIVQALDVGAFVTPAGLWVPYLVLEWLEGKTLAEHLQERRKAGDPPYSVAEAIKLLEPAARALAVAHQNKIAHRDVKPPNLFVVESSGQRTVKVLDFGIAKVLVDYPSFTSALEATKAAPTAFTPRYGAPEQFNKQRGATGPWTDVFALALIFVELVTGQKALDGDDPTQLYIAAADPTLRPTARARGAVVPDAVEEVLQKALEVEPRQRYVDAGELWDALVAAAGASGATSGRSVSSSAKSKAAQLAEDSEMLATGEFSEQAGLDVGLTPGALHLQATVPVESEAPSPRASKPTAASAAIAEAKTVMAPGNERAKAPGNERAKAPGDERAKAPGKRLAKDDPMAETPPIARGSKPPSVARAVVAAEAKGPVAAEPAQRRRPIWLWVTIAVLLGGGAGFYVTRDAVKPTPVKPQPSARASAKAPVAPVRAPPSPSASTSTSTSIAPSAAPITSASAEALAQVPAPDDMTMIAAGTFTFGEGKDAPKVTISRPFYLDRTEVTVKAYQECVAKRLCSAADHVSMTPEGADASPSEFAATWTSRCNAPRKALTHPINCVDFTGAESYCRSIGRRLPTEAEWELAARGVEGRAYAWGAEPPDCGRACYDRNASCLDRSAGVTTCDAAARPTDSTREGVHDLGGGVAEWVADGFVTQPPGGVDPKGDPSAPLRVVRGASFLDDAEKLRASTRQGAAPVMAHVTIGFRCALDAVAPPR